MIKKGLFLIDCIKVDDIEEQYCDSSCPMLYTALSKDKTVVTDYCSFLKAELKRNDFNKRERCQDCINGVKNYEKMVENKNS
jgi:hypothetical protein